VYAYFNRRPGAPLDSKLDGFLRFILSEETQKFVADDGDYLPLSPQIAHQQLQKLASLPSISSR
jgi:phosphate transport system substrate-binding protein